MELLFLSIFRHHFTVLDSVWKFFISCFWLLSLIVQSFSSLNCIFSYSDISCVFRQTFSFFVNLFRLLYSFSIAVLICSCSTAPVVLIFYLFYLSVKSKILLIFALYSAFFDLYILYIVYCIPLSYLCVLYQWILCSYIVSLNSLYCMSGAPWMFFISCILCEH